jgi:site-specific recombinase XerD
MAEPLGIEYENLCRDYADYERGRMSMQGHASRVALVRRVLRWFEREELEPEAVTVTDALRFQAACADSTTRAGSSLTNGSLYNYLKAARGLWDYLVAVERAGSNPFRAVRYPRLGDHHCGNVLSEAQMGRLLKELATFDRQHVWYQRECRYRVHVIAEFLYASGLRVAEAASLYPRDLDLEQGLVYLKAGKGGQSRTAFLTSYAADVLARYMEQGRSATLHAWQRLQAERLFGLTANRLSYVVNRELALLCVELQLPVITSHGFRHSLGTHLLRAGCDLRYIQAILGHESLGSTQIYTHVDKQDLKRSLDEHHPRRWQSTANGNGGKP